MIVPADNVKSGTGLSFQQNSPQDALNRHKKSSTNTELVELLEKPFLELQIKIPPCLEGLNPPKAAKPARNTADKGALSLA